MPVLRCVKKPVQIEAMQFIQWTNAANEQVWNFHDVSIWSNGAFQIKDGVPGVETLEGFMEAKPGDYIIRGVAGEYYPCKPDVFWQTYELASSY